MADVAAKAGVSRPALSLLFPDKEAVFDQVVRDLDCKLLGEIKDFLAEVSGFEEKLLIACMTWGRHPLQLMEAHPDSADLFDMRFPAANSAYSNFIKFIERLLAEPAARSGISASPQEFASILVFGMKGFRDVADSLDDFERMVRMQVSVVVRALRES